MAYNTCPWVRGSCIDSRAFNIFDWMLMGKRGYGGLVVLKSLLTLKKGTGTSSFQSNKLPPNFTQPPIPYEVPLEKKTQNIEALWPLL